MRKWAATCAAVLCLSSIAGAAQSQTLLIEAPTIALKSGETTTVGNVYWVSNCRSLLKSLPEVEVLDGPPSLVATIKESMVLPRYQNCPNKVSGGQLQVSAKDVDDPAVFRVTVRITYKTKDGDRQRSEVFNVSLLP